MVKKDRWFWCGQCDCAAIKCPHCNNPSCSGGGCDLCHDEFEEAIRMVREKTAPKKEEVPYHPPVDWDKLLGN
jgi:hypothetical protein